jgi:hypothetical protein
LRFADVQFSKNVLPPIPAEPAASLFPEFRRREWNRGNPIQRCPRRGLASRLVFALLHHLPQVRQIESSTVRAIPGIPPGGQLSPSSLITSFIDFPAARFRSILSILQAHFERFRNVPEWARLIG